MLLPCIKVFRKLLSFSFVLTFVSISYCIIYSRPIYIFNNIGLSLDADRGESSKGSHHHLKLITRRNQADGNWKANLSSNQRFLREVTYVHALLVAEMFVATPLNLAL